MEFDEARDMQHMTFTRTDGTFRCSAPNHTWGNKGSLWCEHIQRMITAGADAKFIQPGMRISVPIFPNSDVFVTVFITEDMIGASAPMVMEFQPDMGSLKRVALSFWNPGEGCRSMRLVILDYLLSKCHPDEQFEGGGPIKTQCPNGAHSLRASRIVADKSRNDLQWKWACIWNIVMERACTACIEESSDDGDNFGVDDSVIPGKKPSWK